MYLCSTDWEVHLPSIYMHCSRSSSRCSSRHGICALLTRKGHIKCKSIRGIYAWLTGWSICLLHICIVLDLSVGLVLCKASMLDWLGRATWSVMVFKASKLYWLQGHLPSLYIFCPRFSFGCSGMYGICAQLTGEGHMKCNGIQCIYAWLTRGSICLLYICIVLDPAVGVAVCKASMLKWLGVHLPSIYMHCPRFSNGCSNMEGICDWLTGEGRMKFNGTQGIYVWLTSGSICLLYICIVLDLVVGVVACKISVLKWLGVHLSSICMHCPKSSSGCSSMTGFYAQMTGGSICLLYIGLVLDLAVGVVVCKTSMLKWLGVHLPSIYMHCPRSISGFSIMQGIYAWLTGKGHMKCNSIQGIYAWLTGWSICLLYICIILDLAVGVAVGKASVLVWPGRATWNVTVFNAYMLDWLGGPSAFYIYALS